MRILCVFHEKEVEVLSPDPARELAGHTVECVSTYRGAQDILREAGFGFHIILADAQVPFTAQDEPSMPSTLLISCFKNVGVRGFGIFIPAHFTTEGAIPECDDFAIVASKGCATPTGQRDWKKLLSLVQEQMHWV